MQVVRGPYVIRQHYPPLTEYLRNKLAYRRLAWNGFRYGINFITVAMFVGLIANAPAPKPGQTDFLSEVCCELACCRPGCLSVCHGPPADEEEIQELV